MGGTAGAAPGLTELVWKPWVVWGNLSPEIHKALENSQEN